MTTWKIGGPAEYAYWPDDLTELVEVYQRAQAEDVDIRLIGRGSNLLISDKGLPGITVISTELKNMTWGEYTVKAEAGTNLAKIAHLAGERGWSGLEFARGIPGTVGGAVVMNAGAHGGEIGKQILGVKVLQNGKVREYSRPELTFAYRESSLRDKAWVLEAEFSFIPGNKAEIVALMQENLSKRSASQPLDLPNAGSIFRNPDGDFAARLIEAAGWKGRCYGGAQVSEKHSNFIVNTGGAKAEDVLTLIRDIQKDVLAKFGIDLKPEIQYLAPKEEAAGI